MGVDNLSEDNFDERAVINHEETNQPKTKGNPSKKSRGGFQEFLAMGLSKPVFDGIKKADYKKPTPIQKAAIPVIRSGQDVVAMARTGSGKTASFLIPMFEMLKRHSSLDGPRALILEPTRELAMQTLNFTRKLGRFMGLHCALIVGGDSMDTQFEALHQHPDILIATPGRLMHVCVEMQMSLNHVQYVVFDEADRLFELGFREQLEEILQRLSATRQTLLFSATLPQMIAEFARAGLSNPTLIRLDKDEKLSEQLQLGFFSVSAEYKLHLLVYIVEKVLKPDQQIIVFASTQLEVQYLHCVFDKLQIPCTFLYSEMDPSSRKISTAKFQKKVVNILIATDIAARGIDIPNLDYVLNYNFPGCAKTFVHRVGRAARAGKYGVALNFISLEEEPYMWDLHKFLGRSVKFSPLLSASTEGSEVSDQMAEGGSWSYQYGTVPSEIYEDANSRIKRLLQEDTEAQYLLEKRDKAHKVYTQSRPKASKEALREMKEMRQILSPGFHPFLLESVKVHLKGGSASSVSMMQKRQILLEKLRNMRPTKTIFELGIKGSRNSSKSMQMKRKKDDMYIAKCQQKLQEKKVKYTDMLELKRKKCGLPEMSEEDIFYEFPSAVTALDEIQTAVSAKNKKIEEEQEQLARKNAKITEKLEKKFGPGSVDKKKEEQKSEREEKMASNVKQGFFIPYEPSNLHSERGYSINADFAKESRDASLELMRDEHLGLKKQQLLKKKWHQGKNSKAVNKKLNEKRIKTECGSIIRATYKTDRYEAWIRKNKIEKKRIERAALKEGEPIPVEEVKEPINDKGFKVLNKKRVQRTHPLLADHNKKLKERGIKVKEEVRNEDQLAKHRMWQKRYAADRERGAYLKKMKALMQRKEFVAGKTRGNT